METLQTQQHEKSIGKIFRNQREGGTLGRKATGAKTAHPVHRPHDNSIQVNSMKSKLKNYFNQPATFAFYAFLAWMAFLGLIAITNL
jgi:hypothetical protein